MKKILIYKNIHFIDFTCVLEYFIASKLAEISSLTFQGKNFDNDLLNKHAQKEYNR